MSRKELIVEQLTAEFQPIHLQVEDESANHHVPKDAQTHFKVIMVSNAFDNLSRVARHKLVNAQLKDEFAQGMHALSMHLYTAAEWELKNQAVLNSPNCKDGFKHNLD